MVRGSIPEFTIADEHVEKAGPMRGPQRIPGQVPTVTLPPSLTAMPPPFDPAMRLTFTEPVLRPEGVTHGLGLEPAAEQRIQALLFQNGALSNGALYLRRALTDVMQELRLDGGQRRAVMQRALAYFQTAGSSQGEDALMSKRQQGLRKGQFVLIEKADARGGSYYRRVPKPGGGFRYYYSADEYAKRNDAHVDGPSAKKAKVKKDVLGAVGSEGTKLTELKHLADKHGADVVRDVIRSAVEGGELQHKGGVLSAAVKPLDKTALAQLPVGARVQTKSGVWTKGANDTWSNGTGKRWASYALADESPTPAPAAEKPKRKKTGKATPPRDTARINESYHAAAKVRKGEDSMSDFQKSGGPFIGPKGGKYADAAHTTPWVEGAPVKTHGIYDKHGGLVSTHTSAGEAKRMHDASMKTRRGQDMGYHVREMAPAKKTPHYDDERPTGRMTHPDDVQKGDTMNLSTWLAKASDKPGDMKDDDAEDKSPAPAPEKKDDDKGDDDGEKKPNPFAKDDDKGDGDGEKKDDDDEAAEKGGNLSTWLKAQCLPTGDPKPMDERNGMSGVAEVARPEDGGKVAGVGATSGKSDAGAATVPSTAGTSETGKLDRLSEDDPANTDKMKTNGLVTQTAVTPANGLQIGKSSMSEVRNDLDYMTKAVPDPSEARRLEAARITALRKGEPDLVGFGVGVPGAVPGGVSELQKSQQARVMVKGGVVYTNASDLEISAMLEKSADGFYSSASRPTLDTRSALHKSEACLACGSARPAIYAECPQCGTPAGMHAPLEKSDQTPHVFQKGPGLRPARGDRDLVVTELAIEE